MTKQQCTVLIVDNFPPDREVYRRYLQADLEYEYIRPPAWIIEYVPVRSLATQQSGSGVSQTAFCGCDSVLRRYGKSWSGESHVRRERVVVLMLDCAASLPSVEVDCVVSYSGYKHQHKVWQSLDNPDLLNTVVMRQMAIDCAWAA